MFTRVDTDLTAYPSYRIQMYSVCQKLLETLNEPSRKKSNSVDPALSIDPDQPKHAEQVTRADTFHLLWIYFLFRESLLYNSIALRRE